MVKVSIIMGIYNCADTLKESIESIIAQTIDSWEMIMCDDGSSDNTYAVAESYRVRYPDHMKLIRNETNIGLSHTLNRCLELAKGEYIARQDGDDMSLPYRLESQIKALEKHPEMTIVSSAMSLFDQTGEWGKVVRKLYPQKKDLICGTPFAHAPSMIRSEVLRAIGGYSENKCFLRVEDYHLWYKLYKAGHQGMNLQEILYRCRDDRAAQKRRKLRYRLNECCVRWYVLKDYGLPYYYLPLVLKPLAVGILPAPAYNLLHRNQFVKTRAQKNNPHPADKPYKM